MSQMWGLIKRFLALEAGLCSASPCLQVNLSVPLDDHNIARPPVAAVIEISGSLFFCTWDNPFDDPTGSDPVLMVVHGTDDDNAPFSAATTIQNWANSAGLPLDFQAVENGGHVPDLFTHNATTGVTLYQRTVDYHHETVFNGLEQGPQPPLPGGCF
jgi:hypothetical protein